MHNAILAHALSIALLVLAFVSVSSATEAMRRPIGYKNPPNVLEVAKNPPLKTIYKRDTGKVQAAYFTNWGIYGANFQPTSINPAPLTHILYSFADVQSDGTIILTDSYADEQKHFPGDSWDETGNNLYGCLKQLYLLKLQHRNLKVVLSIGGWTYSQNGHFDFVTDTGKRSTFVSTAVKLIEDYGFDGIDIDYEYPSTAAQGSGLASLLTSLRTAFDQLAVKKGDSVTYQISAAVPAGASNYAFLDVPTMDRALSHWNLMAYDYAGSWLNYTDNQANLYGGVRTGVSTDQALKWYLSKGATSNKIVMGIPLYGRAFENTAGIGKPYSGIGPGSTEAGIYSYSALPLSGATVFENMTDVTSYSYDSSKKELVSYDTPDIAIAKAQYVTSNGLGGSMFWDLSTDKSGAASLVSTTAGVYGTLDQTKNHINFPNSKWDNIRNNMSGGPPSQTSAPATAPTGSPTSAPTGCGGVSAWSGTTAYSGGAQVSYASHHWTAKWWTQGDTPGGSAGVWTDNGSCT